MRAVLAVVVLLASPAAYADRWVPYTDGRTGGCFQSDTGRLFGCTPQPQRSPTTSSTNEGDLFRSRDDSRIRDLERRTRDLESQNRSLQNERSRQDAIERSRAIERRQAMELANYYESRRQNEAGKAREREWLDARAGCRGPQYETLLKQLGLKRHPSAKGICVPIDYKSGSGVVSAAGCPPC
jgi:hypothetical protein